MKLAVSSYEFSNMTFAQIAKFLNELGVNYLELWPEHVANEKEADVKASLEEYNIQVSCVSARSQYRMNAEAVDKAQEAIQLAMDLASTYGAKYVTTYLGGNPSRDYLTTLKLYQQNLRPCLEEAASRGQTILLENMFDHRNEDPQGSKPSRYADGTLAIYEMITTEFENFGITYDPVNFYIAHDEAYPYAYEVLKGCNMPNVHIKDMTRYDEWLYGDRAALAVWEDSVTGPYLSLPAGQGVINWEGIIRRLKRDGFDGYITVDIMTKESDRVQAYHDTVNFTRRLMALE
ncbi:MAG: sugar phosphate isomerase/epimerase family protein [Chloroflexota bacterium]